eukprot:TRINITY_DN2626_c4_g1_i1.p1 TRINITY_DN2626_c4_g1~~TRINITY_DN2626_c4_g1_i1.p1  ORF type:complete len:347 (+),score=114.62 TRINITY_DN2626_c4_g1_i1:14-1054(+)
MNKKKPKNSNMKIFAVLLVLFLSYSYSTIITTKGGYDYDITPLQEYQDIEYKLGLDTIRFAIARNLHHHQCETPTPACIEQHEVEGSPAKYHISGKPSYKISEELVIAGQGFTMTYIHGDECDNGDTRKFSIILECDFDYFAKVESVEEHCHSIVNIRSKYACPIPKNITSVCQTIKNKNSCVDNCECGWCSSGKGCIDSNEKCYTSLITSKTCSIRGNNNNQNQSEEEEEFIYTSLILIIVGIILVFLSVVFCCCCCVCVSVKLFSKPSDVTYVTPGETPGGFGVETLSDHIDIYEEEKKEETPVLYIQPQDEIHQSVNIIPISSIYPQLNQQQQPIPHFTVNQA